jgi:signal transduction histidine kinase/CheY-like chemotaxis protein
MFKSERLLTRVNLSFEKALVIALVLVISSVSYTAYLGYQSLIQLTAAVSKNAESEVKLLLIKGVANDLTAAESNIKSYGLSKQRTYLGAYRTSVKNVETGLLKLDSLIPAEEAQQVTFDSMSYYVFMKMAYLGEFSRIQERGAVINELNVLSRQIEQNKKILGYYLNARDVEAKKKAAEEKPGFMKRVFRGKAIQKEEAETKEKQLKEATERLSSQIRMMEKVKGEIGQVKRRQGSTLKNIDKKELSITQQTKVLNEKMNAWMISLEMDELAINRLMIEDIDRRHNRTDKLIGIVSLMGAVALVVIGFVVAGFINRKNAYQAALLLAKNEAEQYSILQEQFLANMSHEIRTPMNAISGFTGQLLKTPLDPKQRSYLDIVQQSVAYLLVVVNDILDYAKLKADKLTVEELPFSLTDIVTETVSLMESNALTKGIRLESKIAANLPPTVISDPVRLKQILLNLIGNALKFTGEGSVTVSVETLKTTAETCSIRISIKDTGIGIPEHKLESIFNAFEQAERSTSRKYGGSGLGLSITQKLVQLLNGTIAISSKVGKGTEVKLEFEWLHSQEMPAAVMGFEFDTFVSLATGKRFLIADDEEWNSTLLTTIFDSYKIKYVVARNGKEVLDHLNAQPVDLILMDVRMPEMDGFEATRTIRNLNHPHASVPIIGITADITQKQVQLCYDAGMNMVLGKPFTEISLGETIYHTLSGTGAQQNLVVEVPVIAGEKAELYSIAVLEEMGNGDHIFTIKMLRIFMQNGRQTFEQMDRFLMQQQWEEIGGLAHKMLPATRQLEANRLLDTLKKIEERVNEKQLDGLELLVKQARAEFVKIHDSMEITIAELEK